MDFKNSVISGCPSQLDKIVTACRAASSVEDLLNEIYPELATWIGADIVAITMVKDRSVMVASRQNIDPILQQRICVHSSRCIGMETELQKTRHCGLDLIWVGKTPTYQSGRLNSESQILWTGAIQFDGWLRGIVTLYREQIEPLTTRQVSELKMMMREIREAMSRFDAARLPALATVIEQMPSPQVLVFRLDHTGFMRHCFGEKIALEVQCDAALFLERHIADVESFTVLDENRIIMTRKAGVDPLTSDCHEQLLSEANLLVSRHGLPIFICEETTRTLTPMNRERVTDDLSNYFTPREQTPGMSMLAG